MCCEIYDATYLELAIRGDLPLASSWEGAADRGGTPKGGRACGITPRCGLAGGGTATLEKRAKRPFAEKRHDPSERPDSVPDCRRIDDRTGFASAAL